jgi:uncharacterized membrane protein
LAYLFSIPGAAVVLLVRRGDPFATYHARQSLAIGAAAVAVPLVWAVVAWVVTWIPLAGPVMGVSTFALVLAAYVALGFSALVGMVYALRGRLRPVPLVGDRIAPPPAVPVARSEVLVAE